MSIQSSRRDLFMVIVDRFILKITLSSSPVLPICPNTIIMDCLKQGLVLTVINKSKNQLYLSLEPSLCLTIFLNIHSLIFLVGDEWSNTTSLNMYIFNLRSKAHWEFPVILFWDKRRDMHCWSSGSIHGLQPIRIQIINNLSLLLSHTINMTCEVQLIQPSPEV